jgi:hypothetical protein
VIAINSAMLGKFGNIGGSAMISAVLHCHKQPSDLFQKRSYAPVPVVIHHSRPRNPLLDSSFGMSREFRVDLQDQKFKIREVRSGDRSI